MVNGMKVTIRGKEVKRKGINTFSRCLFLIPWGMNPHHSAVLISL